MKKQPIRNKATKPVTKKKVSKPKLRKHPKYGTSKLEDRFAKEFLDKLGIPYERQFEAKEIGRFYDFKIGNRILIEVDGDYYHGKGKVFEEKSPMQKHNEMVDGIKNRWAVEHNYLLYRVWESDIINNGTQVMKELKEILDIDDKRENKKKRH